uniref:Uncharacterized protein n=1 Tax=Oryza rufipogon TaxID=4529 RepID=A0A0E0Q6L7_ORYRU
MIRGWIASVFQLPDESGLDRGDLIVAKGATEFLDALQGSLRYLGSLCGLDDVWKETNARVFHNREKSVGLLFGAIKEEVIIWKEAGVLKGLRE